MATGTIEQRIVTKSFTGTTGASGNLNLSSYVDVGDQVISVSIPQDQIMAIPFKTATETYAKCVKWNQTTYATANNIQVSGKVSYIPH